MVNGLNLLFQFADSFAFIVLAAAGLAIIFGIMGVINLAHGEFIMVGAYATTIAHIRHGLPLPVAMVVGVVLTTIFGVVVERLIISAAVPNWIVGKGVALARQSDEASTELAERIGDALRIEPLYDRLADSMVATWGLSLVMVQGVRIVYGNSMDQIGTPAVPFVGSSISPNQIPVVNQFIAETAFSYSAYRVFLAPVAVGLLVTVFCLFRFTDYGMRARATIQDDDTARALGVDTSRTYMTTFAIGSALAGFAGALYAPTQSMVPGMGAGFLVESFVAVVVGGPSVVLGTTTAGAVLGGVGASVTNLFNNTYGQIALLVVAIVLMRFLPDGITGWLRELRSRYQEGQ